MSNFASVCVLSYERPKFLRACVETLLDAGDPFELIIHDDGSEDGEVYGYLHEMIIREQLGTVIFNRPGHNEGVGNSVKRMFDIAQGDLLIKVDQDLVFREGWLAKARKALEDPAIGCLGFFKYHHPPVAWEDMKLDAESLLEEYDTHHYCKDFCGSAFAIPRKVYEECGPLDTHSTAFAEDFVFKNYIHEHTDYFNAITEEDLCANVGFGIGPSTVVTAQETVRKIHDGPLIYSGVWK